MVINKLKIKGTYEITLNPIKDERGFFMRTFDKKIFNEAGLNFNWVQENHSRTIKKGTIRGLHFQLPPYSETKLIRCLRGKILDVFVDLRKDSETFGQWDSIELSEDNYKMVLVPRGFAHGFCSLVENSEVVYKVDNFYTPQNERGIIWNDDNLKIDWPVKEHTVSEKDKKNLTYKEFIRQYKAIEIK